MYAVQSIVGLGGSGRYRVIRGITPVVGSIIIGVPIVNFIAADLRYINKF